MENWDVQVAPSEQKLSWTQNESEWNSQKVINAHLESVPLKMFTTAGLNKHINGCDSEGFEDTEVTSGVVVAEGHRQHTV